MTKWTPDIYEQVVTGEISFFGSYLYNFTLVTVLSLITLRTVGIHGRTGPDGSFGHRVYL